MAVLKIGSIYRTARPYSAAEPVVDGLQNLFHLTRSVTGTLSLLDSGINPIAPVRGPDGLRIPAILISSSPHKTGSEQTPWHDTFDPDHGFVRYYGDNKTPAFAPERPKGNAQLLQQFRAHTSPDSAMRQLAVPLVFFRRVTVDARLKGNLMFQGFGVITAAALVTQTHPRSGPFANYVFDVAILSLAAEGEDFDWKWINARRDPALRAEATLKAAPKSWRDWIRGGAAALESCRRRVQKFTLVHEREQRPAPGSEEEKILRKIYEFYDNRKHRFENLASLVARSLTIEAGAEYREGWISPPSGDGGWDFVGRLDIGAGVIGAKIVCLGQAKCESPRSPTNGNSIARLVARLQRGWIGFYVTTSFFSIPVQREVQLDKYPVVLVHGRSIAETVRLLMNKRSYTDVDTFLRDIDARHQSMVKRRDPSDVLQD